MLGLGLGLSRLSGVFKGIVKKGLQLWLDFNKSEVIGGELVVNGDFATGSLFPWAESSDGTGSITVVATDVGYGVRIQNTVADGSMANLNVTNTLTSGVSYEVTYRIVENNQGRIYLYDSVLSANLPQTVGTHTVRFVATSTTTTLVFNRVGNEIVDITITDISLKEVTQFVKDKSPNTNNAKLFTGKALSFNGNDYVDLGSQSNSGSELTLAAWIEPTDLIGTKPIFSFGDFLIRVNGDDINVFADVGNAPATFSDIITTNKTRVIATISGTNVSLYINDSLIDTKTVTNPLSSDSRASYIGLYGASKFNGIIADVQLYNKAWTASDVAFDYNNPNHLAIDNSDTDLVVTDLKGYWALSEGDGLVAYDSGSTLEEDVVQNGDFSELGSDLVVNGDFDNGLTNWSNPIYGGNNSASLSIDNGALKIEKNADLDWRSSFVSQSPISYVSGKTYEIKFSLKDGTTNGSDVYIRSQHDISGSDVSQKTLTSEWVEYTEYYVANSNSDDISFGCIDWHNSGSGEYYFIDNISVKQVDPNDEWTLGTGWSYGDGLIKTNGSTYSNAVQENIIENGKLYQIKATVAVGSVRFYLGTSGTTHYSLAVGDNTIIATSEGTSVTFRNWAYATEITNISVTEITPSAHGGIINGATYVPAQPTIPQLGMMDWAKGSNLALMSNKLNTAPNVIDNSGYTSNQYTSPSGSITAAKFTDTTANDRHGFYQYLTYSAAQYTISIYAKKIDIRYVCLASNVTGSDAKSFFDLESGVVVSSGAGFSTSIESVGNGWFRLSATCTATSGNKYVIWSAAIYGTSNSYVGNGSDFTFWGLQIEQSSSAGNYILTDGEAAIDVTTIQNPTNKGYDILGNALRLREHAFNLDGSGYAEVADDNSLDITTEITIAAWVYPRVVGHTVIVDKKLQSYLLYVGTTGNSANVHQRLFINSISSESNTYLTANKWNYVTVTYDGSFVKFYLDGTADGSTAQTGVINTDTNDLKIGVEQTLGGGLDELLDEVLIYNRALTQKEITNNYNIGLQTHNLYGLYALRMAKEGFTLDTNSCVRAAIYAIK